MVKLREPQHLMSDGKIDIQKWLTRVSHERTETEVALIYKACQLVQELNLTNQEDLLNGLEMSEILDTLGLDTPTIISAILYKIQKKALITEKKIQDTFGIEVLSLLYGVQKIDDLAKRGGSRKTENLRRLLLAIVEDVRVVLIKLASRICEMRSAVNLNEEERREIALETQSVYVPLANRLGIGQIKWELEDLAFRFLEPVQYKHIAKLLDEKRINRENYIHTVERDIDAALKNLSIKADVHGRVKHIYSIWKKMQRKGVGYYEIYDVRAIRISVPSVRDCYAALGVIHTFWKHIPKEFDDYIANPKENGYRSLHTAVIGPEGKTLEVQIRTFEMHEQAELGVAAHWRYKEKVVSDLEYESKLASLRQILKWQDESLTESESLDSLETEVFRDRVYVLTPKGEVIELMFGATVLDFAYHIHTEIGNRCRGAKVNGKMVPLTHALKSGDHIEILTAKTGGPSRDWLNRDLGFLKTSRARAKAQQWFKRQDREQNISDGREILDRELKRLGVENIKWDDIAHQLKIPKVEDMLAALGGGDLRVSQVLGAVQTLIQPLFAKAEPDLLNITKQAKIHASDIVVSGVGNLLSQIARCCKPVPGDEIIGYITLGRGVSVHRKDCLNILQAAESKQNRLIQVEWGSKIKSLYLVDILIHAYDREGLLRDISSQLSMERINILSVTTNTNKKLNIADFRFTLEISSIELLSKVLVKIQLLPNIIDAKRVRNA